MPPPQPGRAPTILVVEERRRDRHQLVSVLASQGYVVFEANDTRSALDLIDRQHPQLVISSANARPVGGADLVRRLRARPEVAGTPVAFYAGTGDEQRARATAARFGIREVLTNATSPDALLRSVRALLEPRVEADLPTRQATSDLREPPASVGEAPQPGVGPPRIVITAWSARDLAQIGELAAILTAGGSALGALAGANVAAFGLLSEASGPHRAVISIEPATVAEGDTWQVSDQCLGELRRGEIVRWAREGSAGAPPVSGSASGRLASGLAVPLQSSGRSWGWLVIGRDADAAPFSDREETLVRVVASYLCGLCDRVQGSDGLQGSEAVHSTRELQAVCAGEVESLGSWEGDASLETLTWSDSLAALFGRDDEPHQQRCEAVLTLLHADDRVRVAEAFSHAVTEGGGVDVECRFTPAGSFERTLHILGHRVTTSHPSVFVGVVADITLRRRLEARLLQAQRTSAMGLLAASVAHDFNNVLTAILGQARLLADDLADTRHRREMEQIHRTAERGTELTRQLLVFSRTQATAPTIVGLNDMIEDVMSMLQRLLGGHITLHTDLDPEAPAVRVDRGQLEQVVLNLVVNARDAMPSGGRIDIRTRRTILDGSEQFSREPVAAGVYASLSVADTGTGIDDGVKDRIFDPFFTTKARGEGTGLGLTTVAAVVKRCGGHLEVRSTPGRGSVFVVYLPAIERRTAAPAARSTEVPAVQSGARILVIEDEPEVRQLVRAALERAGYEVMEASGAQEAETLIARVAARLDLVIADVLIPGGSGPELLRRLMEVRPSIRAIFMSGYPDDSMVAAATAGLGAAFIQKPFTIDGLIGAVRDVLSR